MRAPVNDSDQLPVSARVGNVKNNNPSLIEPIAAGIGSPKRRLHRKLLTLQCGRAASN
jgi:hypothetical protein